MGKESHKQRRFALTIKAVPSLQNISRSADESNILALSITLQEKKLKAEKLCCSISIPRNADRPTYENQDTAVTNVMKCLTTYCTVLFALWHRLTVRRHLIQPASRQSQMVFEKWKCSFSTHLLITNNVKERVRNETTKYSIIRQSI